MSYPHVNNSPRNNAAPSRARTRDLMGMGSNTSTGNTLRSRAGVRERFYDPAIANDLDAAVDYAMAETGGDARYRACWCFYCLHLGINTFVEQVDRVMSYYRAGEIAEPPKAFHKRLKRLKDQLDKSSATAVIHPQRGAQ